MKFVKKYESFKADWNNQNLQPVNEEFLKAIGDFFKNIFKKAVDEVKKLGKNPDAEQLEDWVRKNPLNPQDDTYLFKKIMEEFGKKTEANEQDCLDLVKNILDPQTGALGKDGLQTLYDDLLKAFGKELPTTDIVKFYLETIRNRAIKDYKYAGGPDLKVGTDTKIDDKKVITDMKDTTHLPEFKKAIAAAAQDNKKRKQLAIDWVNKTLVTRLDKYASEINDEQVDAYLKTVGKKSPEGGVEDLKPGESVIYKRDKFNEEEWKKLTDEDKKKPTEGKMKELQDKEMIGIKKVKEIKGDEVSFEDADFKKKKEDILGKSEAKAEDQEDLSKKLGELKTKKPEDIKKVSSYVNFISDEKNKDKIAEIEKIIGGGE